MRAAVRPRAGDNRSGRIAGESFLAQPTHALRAAAGMLALVVLMAILVPAGPLHVDRSWSEAMRHLETPLLTDLALAFNWLGRGLGRALGLTLVGLLLLHRRRWLALAAFAVAESLAPLLSVLLKALVERPRPPDGLIHAAGSSFPSGHATYAGATSLALVLLFTAPGTPRRWWWTLATLGVLGMAWSRTYLQVHWLTDVIAGALLGSGIALLVFAIAQIVTQRNGSLAGKLPLAREDLGCQRVASSVDPDPPACSLPCNGDVGGRCAWTHCERPSASVRCAIFLRNPRGHRGDRLEGVRAVVAGENSNPEGRRVPGAALVVLPHDLAMEG
jgi:membrane-associated phospholipid phosphatase